MTALAYPLIEAVVARVLIALGIGVAGEAAREAVKARNEEADRARSSPIAQVETRTKAQEKCKECPPDKGAPFNRSTAGWSEVSIAYQFRICGLPVGAGFITEWTYNAITFDGFDSSQCLLKEAKARYDQFFDEFGEYKYEFSARIFDNMLGEAVRQNLAAVPKPMVVLRWHFMEPMSYRVMRKVLREATPQIEVAYAP